MDDLNPWNVIHCSEFSIENCFPVKLNYRLEMKKILSSPR